MTLSDESPLYVLNHAISRYIQDNNKLDTVMATGSFVFLFKLTMFCTFEQVNVIKYIFVKL